MWDHDIGCLPVVDAENHVIGMLTDRDACMACYLQGLPLGAISVEATMARQVFSCRPTDGVEDALASMKDRKVRRMPVVDGERRLLGVLTMNSLALECAREARLKAPDVKKDSLVETLAAIGEPRQESRVSFHVTDAAAAPSSRRRPLHDSTL